MAKIIIIIIIRPGKIDSVLSSPPASLQTLVYCLNFHYAWIHSIFDWFSTFYMAFINSVAT